MRGEREAGRSVPGGEGPCGLLGDTAGAAAGGGDPNGGGDAGGGAEDNGGDVDAGAAAPTAAWYMLLPILLMDERTPLDGASGSSSEVPPSG